MRGRRHQRERRNIVGKRRGGTMERDGRRERENEEAREGKGWGGCEQKILRLHYLLENSGSLNLK